MQTKYKIKLSVLRDEIRESYTLANIYEGENVEAALEYCLKYLKEQGFEFEEIKKNSDKGYKYNVLYKYKKAYIYIEEEHDLYLIQVKYLLK